MEKRQASSFYAYFEPEEKSTIDQMVGFFNRVVYRHQPILTDFLDPGQRNILKTVVGKDLVVQEFGGYQNAEKKRVWISLDWQELALEDFLVTPCEVNYPSKFAKLNHSAILGSLANSGVEVDTFGDIITDGNGRWQFFVKTTLLNFFTEQITRIGRNQVRILPIDQKDVLIPEDDSREATIIVASLRLDAVLAGLSNQSRGQVKAAITQRNVKLNWHVVQDSNIIVKVADIFSLRHFGRSEIVNIVTTKKGKYRVVLKLWQTKKNK
ncbi:YlmH/Sll1252 family protein [Lactobacillus sp. ESL0684]|uniref:YlmH family RNA-binding protein n=1 Tax=Lactobacillus sp. ESL0684 TaxID=2983213 RepID=UPI0023F72000|nr:YlmH/Sll1252 family protein [Lactobacillus sp. ESL0684]WEV44513.1 YlmH/Sll1252 family protein [Lactobacillus sp. ESL0684]